MHYILGVSYARRFRSTYASLLKIDYPRIPYPKNVQTFWAIVEKGRTLHRLHLFEAETLSTVSTRLRNKDGRVATTGDVLTQHRPGGATKSLAQAIKGWNGQIWINKRQYFTGIKAHIWEFYVGGYQPAQKWLKDRKGRALTEKDVLHYSKIIHVLEETCTVMDQLARLDIF